MENGREVIAKVPFAIAGPAKYTTAAEVGVLQYVGMHTKVPVPKVLTWSADSSNPVGAEYIIMEKAAGVPLYKRWTTMNDHEKFLLVKALSKLESELTAIHFPACGGLYLRESMAPDDAFEPLELALDPAEKFCIGPSCDKGWYEGTDESVAPPHLNNGPWTSLSCLGVALVDRAVARVEHGHVRPVPSWHGSSEEQIATLEVLKRVMSSLDPQTLLGKASRPVLWHTDLHMANIFVSEENPTNILAIIDWEGLEVLPLCLQARFPEFLTITEEYSLGMEMPKLPNNYHEMDADEKEIEDFKLEEAKLAKAYELATGAQNIQAYDALFIPLFLRDLFVRCKNVSDEGIAPLRACLIELSKSWSDAGFSGECPLSFSKTELSRHDQQFAEYGEFNQIQKMARELLGTDQEGWISPQLDFSMIQQQNRDLLKLVMDNSADYGMSPANIQRIWPFR